MKRLDYRVLAMQADVPAQHLRHQSGQRNQLVRSNSEATAEWQKQGHVPCVDGRMRQAHDLTGKTQTRSVASFYPP